MEKRAYPSNPPYWRNDDPKKETSVKKLLVALAMVCALAGVATAEVNINTATKEEPMTVKGIGEKRAQEIIEYRKKHGNFKSVDDLEKVPGIGPGMMMQIRLGVSVTRIKVAADTKMKAAEPAKAKGDGMKAEKAKEKVAEKSKADEKGKAEKKGDEQAEKKSVEKATKNAPDVKATKDEKKMETK
jgi:competence protein ComEA